jgi:hypothetical protein
MAIATYDDANLVLRLYELRRDETMRKARVWFQKNARFATLEELFTACPPGSPENAYWRQVTSYYEMVASFLTAGVLQPEIYYQSGREMLLVWVRLRHLVGPLRESYKDPTQYRNLEHAAAQYIEWMNRQGPDVFESFVKRVG